MLSRVPAALALTAVCALGLAACGGDDKPVAKPKPSPTASPTPTADATPTKPEVTEPIQPEFAEGKDGQEAFATYVVEAWAHSLATNDTTLLRKISLGGKPCQGCKKQDKEVAKRTQEGWYVYPFEITIDSIRLITTAIGTTARVRMDIPETRSFFDDGSFRNTSPAHDDTVFTVSMQAGKKQYRLVGFAIS